MQTFDGAGNKSGEPGLPRREDYGDGAGEISEGSLVAWDPVTQTRRWSVPRERGFNGGTLATDGNLVFQGTATGDFQAFSADTGALLWSHPTDSAITAAPVSFEVAGEQYILVGAGGGGHARFADSTWFFSERALGPSRLLAFKLSGTESLPITTAAVRSMPEPPSLLAEPAVVKRGAQLYVEKDCYFCHGPNVRAALTGTIPDLRYLTKEKHGMWHAIVVGGAFRERGMLGHPMPIEDSEAIHAYVISRAREDYHQAMKSKRP